MSANNKKNLCESVSAFSHSNLSNVLLAGICMNNMKGPPPTVQEVFDRINGERKYAEASVGRTYNREEIPEPATPTHVEFHDGINCPRFAEPVLDLFDDPMLALDPDFLKWSNDQFNADFKTTDVISNVTVGGERKRATYVALNEAMDYFSTRSFVETCGAVILHHCDMSYLDHVMQRFVGHNVKHVTFLHSGSKLIPQVLSKVDYTYSFYSGAIDEYALFHHDSLVLKHTRDEMLAHTVNDQPDPLFAEEWALGQYEALSNLFSGRLSDVTYFRAVWNNVIHYETGLDKYLPLNYDIYFGFHQYELLTRKSIRELATIMHTDSVGIVSVVNAGALLNPLHCATNGYRILGQKGDHITVYDEFTTRTFHEVVVNEVGVQNNFLECGAVFGIVTKEFFPNFFVSFPSGCDKSFSVYGFHFCTPIVPVCVPSDWIGKGEFYVDTCVQDKNFQFRMNAPIMATFHDMIHTPQNGFLFAPKLDGVAAALVIERNCARIRIHNIKLEFTPANEHWLPPFACPEGTKVKEVFQVELFVDSDAISSAGEFSKRYLGRKIKFKIVDYLDASSQSVSRMPFGVRWSAVQTIMQHNPRVLQEYTTHPKFSDEGIVIQPVLKLNQDIVRMWDGKGEAHYSCARYIKVHTEYSASGELTQVAPVKKSLKVDFCLPIPRFLPNYTVKGLILDNASVDSSIDLRTELIRLRSDTPLNREKWFYKHRGRYHEQDRLDSSSDVRFWDVKPLELVAFPDIIYYCLEWEDRPLTVVNWLIHSGDVDWEVREIEIFEDKGRAIAKMGRLRHDRVGESISKIPDLLLSYEMFYSAVSGSAMYLHPHLDNGPTFFKLWKFSYLLFRLFIAAHRGCQLTTIEFEQLMMLIPCEHEGFMRCPKCAYYEKAVQKALTRYPEDEFKRSVSEVRGYALKFVRDEFFGRK
jgi:hypothetical protein